MKKKVLGCFGGFAILFVVLALVGTWFYGPQLGAALLGRPILMVSTPNRYATFAFDFAERHGLYADSPEFAAAREAAEAKLPQAESVADTHELINDVLKAAGGKHSRLVPPAENQQGTKENSELPTVTRQDDIVQAKVPELLQGPIAQEYADTLAAGLSTHVPGACGVIVDLRGNTGGDMGPMLAGLSSLLPDGTVLTFRQRVGSSDVTISGSSVAGGGTPVTAQASEKFTVPVALLTDDHTASSGEATLLSFRGLDNTRSFGKPTAGYASSNMNVNMPDGAAILLTNAQDVARTGEAFAEDPIAPDVDTDQPVEKATEWLKHECS